MKMKMIRKLTALLLAVIIITTPVYANAGVIEGANTEEKSMNAGYDLYETIAILMDEYVGDEITVEQLYEAALRGIAEELDEYSYPLSEEEFLEFEDSISGNYEGLGIVLTNAHFDFTYVREVFEDSPAEKAGILSGDIIMKVNGEDASKMTSSQVSELILTSVSKTIKLEINRGNESISLTVVKAPVHMKTVNIYKIEELLPEVDAKKCENIRYVTLTSFGDKTYDEFADALEQLKDEKVDYIILDLRDNGGGYLSAVEKIAKLIVPAGPVYHIKTGNGQKYTSSSELSTFTLKHIVVLTNGNTASASELLASALQDSKAATLIGQKTFGKGVVQDLMPIITGGVFKYTSAEYLRRNGGKVNKVGVSPDIVVDKPDYIEDFAASTDDVDVIISDVRKLMAYIGFKVDDASTYTEDIKKEIMKFQVISKLNPTGIPDMDTVTALNNALYELYLDEDAELQEAYNYLIEKFAQ